MRLIDADALIANKFKNAISYNAFVNLVKRQETVKPEPCSDAVNREAVLDKAYAYGNGLEPEGYCVNVEDIQALPSIEPERKTGIWLETEAAPHRIYCSACFSTYIRNKEWLAWKDHMVPRNYCPNCGAKMEDDDGK